MIVKELNFVDATDHKVLPIQFRKIIKKQDDQKFGCCMASPRVPESVYN